MTIKITIGDIREARTRYSKPDYVHYVVERRLKKELSVPFKLYMGETRFSVVTKTGTYIYRYPERVREVLKRHRLVKKAHDKHYKDHRIIVQFKGVREV